MIYLDNAATTFPKPECVYKTMNDVNRTLAFNAGRGSYKAAREASCIIEETKERMADLFHAKGYADIVLTPSVTHALNQVLNGIELSADAVIYVSPYEHNAVARTVFAVAEKTGAQIEILSMRSDLSLDTDKIAFQFSVKTPSVVVLNALSNVTGYILPVEKVFSAAKQYGAITILDAAQAAGLIQLDMKKLNADVICFAGHKTLMGPFGVGGFTIRNGMQLKKHLTGGTGSDSLNLDMPNSSPARYEASSTNVVAVAGLLASLKNLDIEQHYQKVRELTDYLITQLSDEYKVRILGNTGENLGILSFVVDGYSSDEVGTILDEEYDIAVRTGYHCAPFIHDYLQDKEYNGTIRVGVGMFNTKEDIDALINAIESI